ncbi:biotin-dependent carboxyltransferase family protein [Sporomusa malonica]|uniref:5-oxoprolinase subunit C family protein n=1 Tax=Sporomusa malonica TaxID=112901 RepID=UPI00352A7B0C
MTTLQQGYFTTIQDEGRWGYQAYGMPIAGAMDRYAYRIANILAGNQETAAVIEMTDSGAAFKFDQEQFVAVCGADMQGKLNGKLISNWSSFFVPKQGELRFDAAISGCRTYLAIRGGIEVPPVLGSRSTYTRAKIGGYEGRALRQGDVLYVGQDSAAPTGPRRLQSQYMPQYTPEVNLRVLLGPQDNMFTGNAIQTFFNSAYTIAGQADRAGYPLKGPKILPLGKEADIVSDAVGLGAIQIASNGRPFIVTADHHTTRGFAKIGYVIRVDLSKLAQAKPGDKIRFTAVAEQDAIKALQYEQQTYNMIAAHSK